MNWIRGLCLLVLWACNAQAAEDPKVSPLNLSDGELLQFQRQGVFDLAAMHLGRGFVGPRERDLETLQLLLDKRIIASSEVRQLQAVGVVMGDMLARELDMHWVVYEDPEGRSRALRLGETRNFLFPVTMVSRRVAAGIDVKVADVYAKAVAEMAPYVGERYRPRQQMP